MAAPIPVIRFGILSFMVNGRLRIPHVVDREADLTGDSLSETALGGSLMNMIGIKTTKLEITLASNTAWYASALWDCRFNMRLKKSGRLPARTFPRVLANGKTPKERLKRRSRLLSSETFIIKGAWERK